MRWHLQCAYKSDPHKPAGWIGGEDNLVVLSNQAVSAGYESPLDIHYPLYTSDGKTYLQARPGSSEWYAGADGGEEGGAARWRYWNRARPIVWDDPGSMTSTISLDGLPSIKLCRPFKDVHDSRNPSDPTPATWSANYETWLLLTWHQVDEF